MRIIGEIKNLLAQVQFSKTLQLNQKDVLRCRNNLSFSKF